MPRRPPGTRETALDLDPEHHPRESEYRQHNESSPQSPRSPPGCRSIVQRESGAACRRFHNPVRRCISTIMPASIPMNKMNCTHIPAKECAMLLYCHALARRHGLFLHRVRHAETACPSARPSPADWPQPLIPRAHAVQHSPQRSSGRPGFIPLALSTVRSDSSSSTFAIRPR